MTLGSRAVACLALSLLLPGCHDRTAAPATDAWLGVWNGPEGTFLKLEGGEGSYSITIQNLDGPQTFRGISTGDQVEFKRNGAMEHLRATKGVETGMKWLADKSDCLTVRPGEGFCRD
jgi:hypothetical protein